MQPSSTTPPPPSSSGQPPSTGGALKKILLYNFGAAVVIALFAAASQRSASDAATMTGIIYFFVFPFFNVIGLLIASFRKNGTRSAILGFLLAALIMPLIGFVVCVSGLSGTNFH